MDEHVKDLLCMLKPKENYKNNSGPHNALILMIGLVYRLEFQGQANKQGCTSVTSLSSFS